MFTPEQFNRVLTASGLTVAEAARVYGVSRQTIYEWKGGPDKPPHPPREGSILARMAASITAALSLAVERRMLPLATTTPVERAKQINALAAKAQALRPAPL